MSSPKLSGLYPRQPEERTPAEISLSPSPRWTRAGDVGSIWLMHQILDLLQRRYQSREVDAWCPINLAPIDMKRHLTVTLRGEWLLVEKMKSLHDVLLTVEPNPFAWQKDDGVSSCQEPSSGTHA